MTGPSIDTPPASRTGRSALDVAVEAARAAGRVIQDRSRASQQISYKGRADIVTDVDLAAEQVVLELMRGEYPAFGVLAEESKPVESGSQYTWVVDPLDGTRNYANGIPHFCTVVALAHRQEVVLGVIYDPVRDELFTAEKGGGAWANGSRLWVSETSKLGQALLGCDLGYVDEQAASAIDLIRALWPGIVSLRLMGSSALGLAYAAGGRVDLYFHHSLSPWDVATGLLLVREAGGEVVDRQGNPAGLHTPSVIASNRQLIDDFLKRTDGLPWRTVG